MWNVKTNFGNKSSHDKGPGMELWMEPASRESKRCDSRGQKEMIDRSGRKDGAAAAEKQQRSRVKWWSEQCIRRPLKGPLRCWDCSVQHH